MGGGKTTCAMGLLPGLLECKEYVNADASVSILFVWVESVELAIGRVADRVLAGGHSIPAEVVRRRYFLGIQNLFQLYLPVADNCTLYDNSKERPSLIAEKTKGQSSEIHNPPAWNRLMELST